MIMESVGVPDLESLSVPSPEKRMCFEDGDNDHNHNSKDSPRKLKQELNRVNLHVFSQQKSRRLKTKVTSLKNIVMQLRKKQLISSSCEKMLKRNFSSVPLAMLKRINSKSGKGCKYPPELKSFALTLQFYSSKAYEFVRKTFNLALPHQVQVRKWY